jgi:tripartite-type tricarboxylate transporter receptor subunit TctC
MADVRAKLNDLGLDLISSSPEEFATAIRVETPRWAKLIKEVGIRISE